MTGIESTITGAADVGSSDQAHHLGLAGSYFEKAFFDRAGKTEEEFGKSLAWPDDLIVETISKEQITRLKQTIIDFIESTPTHANIGTAAWALSKTGDRRLVPALRRLLRANVHGDAAAMFQIMIALRNCGEAILASGGCTLDEEENRKDALNYLKAFDS